MGVPPVPSGCKMILGSEMEPYGKAGGVTQSCCTDFNQECFQGKEKCVKLSLSHSLTAPDVHVKK